MAMKLLGVIMKRLWENNSRVDMGTLHSEQLCIQRQDVSPDVKKAYSEDKEFFVSYTNALNVEAICSHFGLEDINNTPKKCAPVEADQQYQWALGEFKDLVR